MPSGRQHEENPSYSGLKEPMSSSFNYEASKDRSSLEFQARGEGRRANHQGSKASQAAWGGRSRS